MQRRQRVYRSQSEINDQRAMRAECLTFEAALPRPTADWLQAKIADGVYRDCSDATLIAFQNMMELDAYPQIREQLLRALMDSEIKVPRPKLESKAFFDRLDVSMSVLTLGFDEIVLEDDVSSEA